MEVLVLSGFTSGRLSDRNNRYVCYERHVDRRAFSNGFNPGWELKFCP
jgi:hypothetical protein